MFQEKLNNPTMLTIKRNFTNENLGFNHTLTEKLAHQIERKVDFILNNNIS